MQIGSSIDISGVAGISVGAAFKRPCLGQDTLTSTSADKLASALALAPEARPGKVAQARSLVLEAAYPPQILIQKLTELFAGHFSDNTRGSSGDRPGAKTKLRSNGRAPAQHRQLPAYAHEQEAHPGALPST